MKNKVLIFIIIILSLCVICLSIFIVLKLKNNLNNDIIQESISNDKIGEDDKGIKNEDKNEAQQNKLNIDYDKIEWVEDTSVNAEPWGVRIYITENVMGESKKVKIEWVQYETKNILKERIVDEIIGNPKYVIGSYTCAGLQGIAILTEEGNVYVNYVDPYDDFDDKFKKVPIEEKILKVARLQNIGFTSCFNQSFYFYTETGKLKDDEGNTWEENNPQIKNIGTMECQLMIMPNDEVAFKKYNKDWTEYETIYLMYKGQKIKYIDSYNSKNDDVNIYNSNTSLTTKINILTDKGEILSCYVFNINDGNYELKLERENVQKIEPLNNNNLKIIYKDGKEEIINI